MMSMKATLRKPRCVLSTCAPSNGASRRTTSPHDTSSRLASHSTRSQHIGSQDVGSSPASSPTDSINHSGNGEPQSTEELRHNGKRMPMANQTEEPMFILRPPTLNASLPIQAKDEERRRARMSIVGEKCYNECLQIFIYRYESAKIERARHSDYIEPNKRGRTGNDPKTKRPPKGMRVVIQWDETFLPIGPWAKKFNNYLGCLGRRGDLFNPYLLWVYHPFSSLESAWRDVQKYFILDDNPFAWDYFFVKISRAINEYKNYLKNKYFIPIKSDWERFDRLETRCDLVHFAALLCYWDSDECKDKSKQCKENRLMNDWDHHLGSQSYAQLVHKQKIIRNVEDLDVLERCKLGFVSFSANYKKEDQKTKNLKKVEDLSQSFVQATVQLQNTGNLMDNGTLPKETQIHCVKKTFGPLKKGAVRFAGVGAKVNVRAHSEMGSNQSANGKIEYHSTNSMVQKLLKRDKKRQKQLEEMQKTNQILINLMKLSSPDLARQVEEMTQNATFEKNTDIPSGDYENEDEEEEEEEEKEEEDSYEDMALS